MQIHISKIHKQKLWFTYASNKYSQLYNGGLRKCIEVDDAGFCHSHPDLHAGVYLFQVLFLVEFELLKVIFSGELVDFICPFLGYFQKAYIFVPVQKFQSWSCKNDGSRKGIGWSLPCRVSRIQCMVVLSRFVQVDLQAQAAFQNQSERFSMDMHAHTHAHKVAWYALDDHTCVYLFWKRGKKFSQG